MSIIMYPLSTMKFDQVMKGEEIKELNSMYHDGPVTISADGNTMFFARDGHSTNLYEKDKKNIRTCKYFGCMAC